MKKEEEKEKGEEKNGGGKRRESVDLKENRKKLAKGVRESEEEGKTKQK